jgi:hypothetical protein
MLSYGDGGDDTCICLTRLDSYGQHEHEKDRVYNVQ